MPQSFFHPRDFHFGFASILVSLVAAGLVPGRASADWPNSPVVNLPVCIAPNYQISPEIASDGAGGAIIVWTDKRSGVSYDIYIQHVLASGIVDSNWPACGRALCTAAGDQGNQRLIADGAGGALVVWQDRRAGASFDIYAHHVLSTGVPDPAWPVDGLPVCTADSSQYLPEIATDGAGGALVTWNDIRGRVDLDIYAQHVLATGMIDPNWPANGLAVCTAPGDQKWPRLVTDSAGGAIIVWGDSRGGVSDVYAQRVLASGATDPAWPLNGSPVSVAAGSQQNPELAPDGDGGAFVAWGDYRGGAASDIYSAHVLANGVPDPAWPADGRALCTAAGIQSAAKITPTGPGEAIVAWMDQRSGSSYDIYAQRVEGPGLSWPSDGRALCAAARDQNNPRLTADGTGGAIVTWNDLRLDTGDIYAQHVLADGVVDPAWPSGGSALSTAANKQWEPRILADGSGGAIVTWGDQRSNLIDDVYAQRVQANGQLGGTVVDVPGEFGLDFALDPVRPNPSRAGRLSVSFSLARGDRAALELIDLAGRRVAWHEFDAPGPGRHTFDLVPAGRIPAGVYFVRLREGARVRSVRVALLR